eukprot:TRINITY_DN2281_c0_g2_i8.p2 TRINITY_DN2281_c0_g2~~TRINITY_DN2281_c0_g2_i8.p2  ORF type:complete len:117 (+),score=24.80 TRINITY_DN2281_c0_g2_i8:207-557(+)
MGKEEAKASSNAEVIGVHAAISAAQMSEKGDYRKAQAKAVMFSKWSNSTEEKMKVKNQVAGLYQALQEQQEMPMEDSIPHHSKPMSKPMSMESRAMPKPQQDKLTVAMNKAMRNKK